MTEQSDISARSVDKPYQRRAIGAMLGLVVALTPALAFSGFWNGFFFIGVPVVRRGQASGAILPPAVCLAIVGLLGFVLGMAVAWPDQRRGFVKAFLMICGAALVVLVVLFRNQLQDVLVVLVVFVLLAATLLLFSQIVEWIQQAFRRSRRTGLWVLSAVLLVLVVVSIGINWGWLQFPFSDDGILLTVHRHALAQGWRGYTLELGNRVSGFPDVRVRMSDGMMQTCRVTFMEPPLVCGP